MEGQPPSETRRRTLVERSYDAFNRRDLDTLLELYAEDCVWDMSHVEGWPEDPVYEGREGLARFFNDAIPVWGEFEVIPEEVEPMGGGRFFIRCAARFRGQESGVPVEVAWGQAAISRGGKVVRVDNYSDVAEARRAAGAAR
jgi:ketosteroid isomerase-like protein